MTEESTTDTEYDGETRVLAALQETNEQLVQLNSRLIDLCERLAQRDDFRHAQLTHRAPSDNLVSVRGKRPWSEIRSELERKAAEKSNEGKSKKEVKHGEHDSSSN